MVSSVAVCAELDNPTAYLARREPRYETVSLRGLNMHLTCWGPEWRSAGPPLIMQHGYLDAGASFQFMVDAFERERPAVAMDWRGFGRSEWPQEGYGLPDYLGDLDALLDYLSPAEPVHLLGHSMGGNVVNLYAGVRPERVRSLINLEGLGMPRTTPQEAPKRLRKWLAQLKSPLLQKEYNSAAQLAAVIKYRYPRFSAVQAAFVAAAWSRDGDEGRIQLAADPRHHWVNPVPYKREDAEAAWLEIRAPMLLVLGAESDYLPRLGDDGTMQALQALFPDAAIESIADAGHMLHIEQPALLAALVEKFLAAH